MIFIGLRRLNSSLINKLRLSATMSTIVEISEGKLQGKICSTSKNTEYLAFKSIPYAKPPIGDLRFAAPQPPEKWEGIRDATQDCEISMQYDTRTKTINGSEDCLYLNVFTPKTPKDSKPLPVMMYIHGGGFTTGHGTKEYDQQEPDDILEKDIVYVGINYRLGIFGFLSLNRKEAPGNMGLKDQVQALKWVQKNIKKFNGDPDNVTVFGISAGGASVEYLLLSPMARGLFHKAIAQSGSTISHWSFISDIATLAAKIPDIEGKTMNNADELYEYLKNTDGEKLMLAAMSVKPEMFKGGGLQIGYFLPTIEKPNGDWEPFLDEIPYKLLKEGKFFKVPLISGYCSRESLILLNNPSIFKNLMETKNFFEYLPFDIDDNEKDNINQRLRELYIEDAKNEHEDDFAIEFFTDLDFLGGIYVSVSLIAKESPCYFYEFDYSGGYNYMKSKLKIDRKGACHADDKGYIFKCSLTKRTSDTDDIVRDRFVKMWTDFAKFGNPTPDTKVWKPASLGAEKNDNISYLRIDDKLTMCRNMKPERMKFFTELYNKYKYFK